MRADAELHAEEDHKKRERIDLKNLADSTVYQSEKTLKEHGDKISQDERLAVDRAIGEVKDALKGDDVEKLKKAKDNLLQTSQKLGEAVYKAAQAKAGPASGGPGPGAAPGDGQGTDSKKEDVVDAEVVDEKK